MLETAEAADGSDLIDSVWVAIQRNREAAYDRLAAEKTAEARQMLRRTFLDGSDHWIPMDDPPLQPFGFPSHLKRRGCSWSARSCLWSHVVPNLPRGHRSATCERASAGGRSAIVG